MIYKTITNYKEATKDFLENEKQFHLGVIPTEQSNPITKNLSATIMKDTAQGVKTMHQNAMQDSSMDAMNQSMINFEKNLNTYLKIFEALWELLH